MVIIFLKRLMPLYIYAFRMILFILLLYPRQCNLRQIELFLFYLAIVLCCRDELCLIRANCEFAIILILLKTLFSFLICLL